MDIEEPMAILFEDYINKLVGVEMPENHGELIVTIEFVNNGTGTRSEFPETLAIYTSIAALLLST